MVAKAPDKELERLPQRVTDFIKLVIRKMRYRKKVRADVMAELVGHFEDELRECKSDEEKSQKAEELIANFGDAKLLGVLLRRAKKRCRPLWQTMVARTFQAIGILTLFFIVYVGWFLSGRPVISVDYLAQLNQMVRPTADESLNAAPLYEKAADIPGRVSDDILVFFAENYKEIGDPEVGGRSRRYRGLRAEELADAIGVFFANRGRPDVRRHKGRPVESEITWRINLLVRLKYLETTVGERKLIERWIADQKEALDLVVAGGQKPYYWQKYGNKQNTTEMMAVLTPRLAEFNRLARYLSWRARLHAEKGLYKEAFDQVESCYRLGQHIKGNNTRVIEQLVGIIIESLAAQTLLEILSEYESDAIELTKLQRQFEQILANEDFAIRFEAERLSAYDAIQRCFTQDRFGGGHICLQEFKRLMSIIHGDDSYSLLEDIIEKRAWTATLHVLFTHPNKQETFRAAEEFYDYWESLNLKTPARIPAEGIDIEKETMEIIKGNVLLDVVTANFGRVIEITYQTKTEVQAIVTVIALLRYENDKGFYPKNVNELMTEGYIGELPIDPWSDEPLVYRTTNDDFTLYSIGRNFKDDGGQVIRDYDGRVGTWVCEGDAVFWPAPEPETPEEREKRLEEARELKKSRLWRRSK